MKFMNTLEYEMKLNTLILSEFLNWIQFNNTSRNGYYYRKLEIENKTLCLKIPRARKGCFQTKLFSKWQRKSSSFLKSLIKLSSSGCSLSKIQILVKKLYGHEYSGRYIRKIADTYRLTYKDFCKREIEKKYKCIFADSTYVSVQGQKMSISILLGINHRSTKIIDYSISSHENINLYYQMLNRAKNKGFSSLLFVSDNFNGLNSLSKRYFSYSGICFNHLLRNVKKYARQRYLDRKEYRHITKNLKEIIKGDDDYETSLTKLELFYNANEELLNKLKIYKDDLHTFIAFKRIDKELWKKTYTTNIIENFNRQLKRNLKLYYKNVSSLDKDIATFIINSKIF